MASDNGVKRVINDPIHKIITLQPQWTKIIDTPEFQRLRYLKQLGTNYFVYPSATHTRFEHSIGVCHLAWRLARSLQKLPDTDISKKDVLCVSIAGLCHDLGHGPFSHTWERFMDRAAPEKNWKHENQSVKIFDRIWHKLEFGRDPDLGENARKLICDLIRGKSDLSKDIREFQGKDFLFEIVNNKKNEVDVDKWDYFARDAYYVGTNMSFPYQRLMKSARVLIDEKDNKKSIHYRDLDLLNLYHMFYSRWLFHQRICKHRVCVLVEGMLIDALTEADRNPENVFEGIRLIDYVDYLDDFLKLNDSIFHLLLRLSPGHKSRILIEQIEKRELYGCQGRAITSREDIDPANIEEGRALTSEDINRKMAAKIEETIRGKTGLNAEDFYIDVTGYDYCKKREDPVKDIPIYGKDGKATTFREHVPSIMLTKTFAERKIWFVCRRQVTGTRATLRRGFDEWFRVHETQLSLRRSN